MIETVARALCVAAMYDPDSCVQGSGGTGAVPDVCHRHKWQDYEPLAIAAIKAMGEPSEAMIEAALDANLDIYWGYRADERPGGPEDVWRVMLAAALTQEKG